MRIITRDARGNRRTISVDEVRHSRNVRTSRPMRPMARRTADADEKEVKLTKEQADFLAELVKSGISVDDIVKAVKGDDKDEEEEETEEVEEPKDEGEPDDEEGEDFDFGTEEEEVKDLGDSYRFGDSAKKPMGGFKSIGAIAKKKATTDSASDDVDEKWAKALNKSWSK